MATQEKQSYQAQLHFADGVAKNIEVRAGELVLDAAERQQVFLKNSCRSGVCGICRGTCSSGKTTHAASEALSQRDKDTNKVLTCQLTQQSDATYQLDYSSEEAQQSDDQTWMATVTRYEQLSAGAARLCLSADPAMPLDYSAGQFVDLRVPGTESWRSYSFANLPNDANDMELIIRLLPDGAMSDYLRDRVREGDKLELGAPQGHFALGEVKRPIALMAGGTGISAIVAMLRQLVADKTSQPVSVYYGAATVDELLLLDKINDLGAQLANFEFIPLPQNADDDWQGKTGLITGILSTEALHQGDSDVYVCGPPPMVKAVEQWLEDKQLDNCTLHIEKFLPSQRDGEVAVAPQRLNYRIGENIRSRGKRKKHAVVVGGSIAGMMTARVLSEHFDRVTVLEQDSHQNLKIPRENTPQGWHAHHLLQGGKNVLDRLFPEFGKVLEATGGLKVDGARDFRNYYTSGWKVVYESGIPVYIMIRPILEAALRRCLEGIDGIEYRYNTCVTQLDLDASGKRIQQLHVEEHADSYTIDADMFIDASGKASQFPAMLAASGTAEIIEERMDIDCCYHSTMYRVPAEHRPDWRIMAIIGHRPYEACGGYAAFYGEDSSEMLVTHFGLGLTKAMSGLDELQFAMEQISQPHIAELMKVSTPIRELQHFRYPAMFRRHYEQWRTPLTNFVAVGDALGSADPISGAGMTKAALEVDALAKTLEAHADLDKVPTDFFARAAKLGDDIWLILGEMNFRFKWVKGKRPLLTPLLNWYVNQLNGAAHYNTKAYEHMIHVSHFNRRWTDLLSPSAIGAVLKHTLTHGWRTKYCAHHRGERSEPIVVGDQAEWSGISRPAMEQA